MSESAAVSRATRVARGAGAAVASTLVAAASHGIAGGPITGASLIATTILVLPLCVALAGKLGSLWRLGIAVTVAQFLYHWAFAGIGVVSGSATAGIPADPAPLHAAHLAALQTFVPSLASAGAADATMWLSHAVAAILTIAMLHRGERAVLAIARIVRRALPFARAVCVPALERAAIPPQYFRVSPRTHRFVLSEISHRGPPARPANLAFAAFTH